LGAFSHDVGPRPADNKAQVRSMGVQMTMTGDDLIKGSCHCGAVRFEFSGQTGAFGRP